MYPNDNCALMRHAQIVKSEISVEHQEVLKKAASRLLNQIGEKSVKIFYSPTIRAQLTAASLCKCLKDLDREAADGGVLEWLNCDYREITVPNIQRHSSPNGPFVIFVSHEPDIEHFTGESVKNCDLFSRDFSIQIR